MVLLYSALFSLSLSYGLLSYTLSLMESANMRDTGHLCHVFVCLCTHMSLVLFLCTWNFVWEAMTGLLILDCCCFGEAASKARHVTRGGGMYLGSAVKIIYSCASCTKGCELDESSHSFVHLCIVSNSLCGWARFCSAFVLGLLPYSGLSEFKY
jgi:hypothetical protein